MAAIRITDKIFLVGAIDWDRRLFDELIPLPVGTSYNSYLIRGVEKNVLIDTVDPSKADEFFENLEELGIKNIDYIVCQHAEQDHSGSIPHVLKRYPMAKVVTNNKCKELLIDHLGLTEEDFLIIKDEEEFEVGDIRLKFIFAPWVHWPETMLTYYADEKTLFTCDMFGSHLATPYLYSDEDDRFKLSAKRYYAEIMLPFRSNIRKHLEKVSSYSIDYILPSHGPVHRKPEIILDYYKDWSSDITKPLVIIPYVSMHDSTEGMVKFLLSELVKKGVEAIPLNLSDVDFGEFAMYLVDASVVIIGAPTVLSGPHPTVAYAVMLMNALRTPSKGIGFIGSYGWGGKTEEILKGLLSGLRYRDLGSVFIRGSLKEEEKKRLSALSDTVVSFLKEYK
ncbi:MAG: FprA family A-type flavoprotein [Deltaproteobacteria bacterium]|nr:FprA family A-type flavoprotein [Deltaproteobacteria bacterium]